MKLDMVRIGFAAALLASAAACSPGGTAGGGAATAADASSFNGEWKVTGHIVAPWLTEQGFAPEADAEILAATLTISDTGMTGPAALTCEGATLAVAPQPLASMFDGKVTDAYVAKSALGVEGDATPTLTGCTVGGAARNYHLIAQDTLLLGVGDIVYQFGRPKAEEPAAPAAAAPAAPAAPAEAPKPQ
jgi:hypothetical protein